jgi:tetratricopeptide (TPR) repeat protein
MKMVFEKAMQSLMEQDYKLAISIFDIILDSDPNNVGAHINKGVALVELGSYDEAIVSFDKVLHIDQKNEKALKNRNTTFKKIGLIPYAGSEYLSHVQIQVRNAQGSLISVTETDAMKFLPHPLTDEYLDLIPVKETVSTNGKTYEKREIKTFFTPSEDTFISSTRLVSDKFGDSIVVFFTLNHAYTVEHGDNVTAFWTVLRAVN